MARLRKKKRKPSGDLTSTKRWARRLENNKFVLEYLLAHSCVDCGEKDIVVLEFDHIDPKKKRNTVSKLLHLTIDTVKKEIQKCEVRCCNCHRRRTARQQGWTRRIALSEQQKKKED